jgi:murein DD-endopeptidase MepM/ murein hydrolase activator NlpD
MSPDLPSSHRRATAFQHLLAWLGALVFCAGTGGCKPDDSPFRAENDQLKKQLAKQESLLSSLQDGNKVMQQQIDLLNQELRDAKRATEAAKSETQQLTERLEAQLAQTRRMSAEVQRTAAAQAALSLKIEDKGAQADQLPRPLPAVAKVVEEALARNGYQVKVSLKTDQRAVYVTERKVSNPASLEVAGFRNQYVIALHALPANVTKLSVKAEFEKVAQGGRILSVSAEETAEIERRLIGEISKALEAPSKT